MHFPIFLSALSPCVLLRNFMWVVLVYFASNSSLLLYTSSFTSSKLSVILFKDIYSDFKSSRFKFKYSRQVFQKGNAGIIGLNIII